jgi:hypothetical protein
MAQKRKIRVDSGGAHMLHGQPVHIAPASKRRKSYQLPVRCEPRWRAAAPTLQHAVRELISLLEKQEAPRKRRRSAKDASTFRLAIECIACNLLAVSWAAPDRPLAVPLANAASRIEPIFGKPASRVIGLMNRLGLITKTKGYPYVGPTTVRPTRKLQKHLPLGKTGWNALRIEDNPTVVILKASNTADPDNDDDVARARNAPALLKRWLAEITDEMHTINAAVQRSPIECRGSARVHIAERPGATMASIVTLHHRTLKRTFNNTWDQGGRMFGGFWQTMPRPDRFKYIRIGGERVALVDYGQLFLRLAYAEADVMPPLADLYDLTGKDIFRPGWKNLRDARKKLINALFFKRGPLKQWPGATLREFSEMRLAFPPGTKPRDVIDAIKSKHKPISHLFERGHGLHFMRTESDLITAVTLNLFKRGIVALPIHDAVVVAVQNAPAAKRVMEKAARTIIGVRIPADIQLKTK